MASDVQYGDRNSKVHNFEVFQKNCVQFFAMSLNFRQQHESKAYFVEFVKNGGSFQNGGTKFRFLCITLRIIKNESILFCIHLLLFTQKNFFHFGEKKSILENIFLFWKIQSQFPNMKQLFFQIKEYFSKMEEFFPK
jgi:hypothetical protein